MTVTGPAPIEEWRARACDFMWGEHRIAYWDDGKGRPLLLIHGFPTSSWDWSWIWPRIAPGRRLIAADMLGFGLSDKPRARYSLMAQADLQEALMASLGVEEVDILAHDYGDTVAQELLAREAKGTLSVRLGKVCFLNGGLFPGVHRPEPIQRLGNSPIGFLVSMMMNRTRFSSAFCRVFGPDTQPSEEELDAYWAMMSHQNGHRLTHRLLHYMTERKQHRDRWVGALTQTAVPLALIDGALDPVSGQHLFEHFRAHVPAAQTLLLPHVGHYPQTEAPAEVAKAARQFFAGEPLDGGQIAR